MSKEKKSKKVLDTIKKISQGDFDSISDKQLEHMLTRIMSEEAKADPVELKTPNEYTEPNAFSEVHAARLASGEAVITKKDNCKLSVMDRAIQTKEVLLSYDNFLEATINPDDIDRADKIFYKTFK